MLRPEGGSRASRGTSSSSSTTSRQSSSSATAPHDFVAETVYLPTLCRYCKDVMWSFASGLRCRRCSCAVHVECRAETPNDCLVVPRASLPSAGPQNVGFTRRGIVKEGFLWKMAKADPSWTRLWCICKPEALFFFRPQQRLLEYRNPMLVLGLGESAGLSVANVQALREHCFIVETSSGDYHYFAADSDEERKEWKYAIKHRKAKSRSVAAAADAAAHGDDWANESWIWTPDRPEPSPFAWEDVKPTQIKMLNLLPLIQNEPIAKGSVPELALRADDVVVDKHEVAYFRTKVTKVAQAQSMRRVRLILAELTDAPVPSNFPGVFLVLFRMGKNAYRVRCSKDTNLKRVIIEEVLFRAQAVDMSVSWALPAIEDFMIRCGRLNEYIVDADISLHSIVYVRDAITKSRAIEFDLLPYEAQLHHADGASIDDSPAGEQQSFCSVEADEGLGFDLTVQNCFHVHDVSKRFEVKVKSVENLSKQLLYDANSFYGLDIEGDRVNVFVAFSLYFGEQLLAPVLHTQPVLPSQPIWEDWLVTELLSMENIPREALLCFTLYACKAQGGGAMGMITNLFRPANQTVPLAATEITYADFRGVLRRGSYCLPMWSLVTPAAGSPRQAVALVVEFDATSPKLISFSGETRGRSASDATGQTRDGEAEQEEAEEDVETPAQHEQPLLYLILMRDALYEMSTEEKALVWKYRGYVRSQRPYSLAKVLLAAPSTNRQMTAAIHALLANWPPLPPVHALELLGARYVDTEVRRYAVNCLRELTDRQLVEYLPQLIQVLKSEPHHYSHLFEFLFLRSMRSIVLGHPFFWHLTAELHNESHSARFKLMIEAFLAASDDDGTTEEMKRELAVVAEFARVAKELKEVPKDERTKVLQAKLRLLELPSSFLLPYNPKFEVSKLLVEKCRVMDSMTSPLWLVFENRERQTAHIIFKVGDDLRTDILSLQMIRIMDQLWRNEGLDLHMQPYRAVSTGKDEGIIEVVTNSETTSAISQAYGGGGAVSAFSRTALAEWLRACNPTEAAYREAVTNFTLSCAGYCVATYILGVGDRHNDNIMITYGGNLFHIDFAYFLGRRVTFAGIPRETTPFVLTPAFVQAMGGLESPNFRSFVSHCCRAYNVIRRHGHLFITLFAMMVSSGMSQLESLDDLDYLRRALALELTDAEASARFTQLIQESCSNQITQLNNAVHIFAHS